MRTGTTVISSILTFAGFFIPAFFVGATGQSPVVSDIPDQTIEEGQAFAAIKLDDFVTDIDNSDDQINWSVSNSNELSVNIDQSRIATVSIPSADWNGAETITFTATDTSMNSASDVATFTVLPVNDPPVVNGIRDQVFEEGAAFQPVSLDSFVTDVDNSKDQLVWAASGNTALSVNIDPTSHVATIATNNINWNGSENITFTATDIASASGSDAASYTLIAVNDPPVIGDIPNQAVDQGKTFDNINLDNFVTDVDNIPSEMQWNVTGNNSLTVDVNSSRIASITIPNGWTGTENLTFTVKDPADASASDNASFMVTALAPPAAVNDSYNVSEGGTLNVPAAGVLSNDTDPESDPLTAVKDSDPLHGTLTLNSDGSFLYAHDGSEIATDAFTYHAFDGVNASNTATVTITINPVNDIPVIAGIELTPLAYNEGDVPVQITNTITVTDVDNTTFSSALISISGNYQNDQDVLSVKDTNGISGTWNSVTGQMLLSGNATLANYQIALRLVKYNNTSSSPNISTRTISFTVNDGIANSIPQTRNITVTATNSDPVLAGIEGSSLGYTEGDSPTQITNTITATDADDLNLSSATISITGNYQGAEDILSFTNANGITGSWNSGTGQMSLTGSASVANYQVALRSVLYNNTSSSPNTSARTVSFRVNDGTSNSNFQTRNISVTATNSAPVLAGIEGSSLGYTEGDAATQITNTLTATDADNATLSSATITISGNYQSGEDVLSFTNANGITGSWNSGTGQMALSGSASMANYQTALRSVRYNNTSSSPNTSARTVSFRVNDGTSNSNSQTRNIAITATNSAPVLAGIEGSSLGYTEGDAATQITNTLTVTDADNATLSSATITISGNYQSAEDVLSFTNANGITGSWNSGTGQMSLSGNATFGNYQAALRSVRYNNTSSSPNTSVRTVTFRVNDGTSNSNSATRNIAVTAANDPPVLAGIEGSSLGYTEGDAPTQITNTITVSDVDDVNLASAIISISGNYQNGEDVLSFTNANGISGSWNSGTGQMSLSGNATLANYQAALRSVRYNNTSSSPNTSARTISFRVNDGSANSNSLTRNISITASNSAPVLAGIEGSSLGYTEGDAATQITNTLTVSDADNGTLSSATITISGNYQSAEDVLSFTNANGITGSWNSGTGQMSLSGNATVGNYQAALRSVRYNNTSSNPNTSARTVTFRVNDGTSNSNSATRNIAVTAANDPPVLAGIEGSSLGYTEGDAPTQITNTITVSDVDDVNLASAIISISGNYQNGEDVLSFTNANGISGSWNSGTGQMSLSGNATLANYQAALRSVRYNNTSSSPSTSARTISFRVNDGSANSNSLTRNISITASNSAPVLAAIEGSSLAFTEGDAPAQITNTITANDADNATLSSATITISGNYQSAEDVLSFTNANGITGSWNSGTGQMSLSGNATVGNYQAALRSVRYNNTSSDPNVSLRTISFRVNDGTSNSNFQTRNITVTATNSAPVLAGIEGSSLGYTEGDTPAQITNTITVADLDDVNLTSAIISISVNYQSTEDVLSFTNANGITGTWNSGTGQLSLSGIATLASYQAALRSVRYSNTSSTPNTSVRTISFRVNDGTGNSNIQNRTIAVTAKNDPPVLAGIEGTPIAYNEGNGAIQITNTITVSDPDDVNLASALITISGNYQNDQDVLSFTNANGITGAWNTSLGQLTLTGATTLGNYQAALRAVKYSNSSLNPNITARTITFRVNDGTDNSNLQNRIISVSNQNDPPVASTVNYTADGRIGVVHTGSFVYTDPDGDLPGTHVYQWYISANSSGIPATAIAGATSLTYRPVMGDGGKYLAFEVTPVDILGLAGLPVRSVFRRVNAAPVASNVTVYAPGSIPGQIIRGRFTYLDAEGNPRGNAIYQWYRKNTNTNTYSSPGTPVDVEVDSIYPLRNADAGKFIWFKVKPVATAGSTPGDSVWSNIIGPIGTFNGNISGTAGYCLGSVMPITLSISGGIAPYTVVLGRTGSSSNKDTTIAGINVSPYLIQVKIPGSYVLKSLKDASIPDPDDGIFTADPVVLSTFAKPSAVLTGSQGVCNDGNSTVPLSLNFSGTAPWTFRIRRGSGNDTTYTGISADPYTIHGRVIGTSPTTYRMIAISDAHCAGDTAGSGTARVNYLASPNAIISGRDTICPVETGTVKVIFSGSAGPWSITYLRNGSNPVVKDNITNFSYDLVVPGTGTYTLSRVQDAVCTGKVSGTGTVVSFTLPTATISGTTTICEHTSGNLNIALTGDSPWKFSYRYNTGTPVEILNVQGSPNILPVRKDGTYTLFEVFDKHCQGTVSGSAVITVTPAPDVTITGLAPAYDKNYTQMVPITGTPAGGNFSGSGGLFYSNPDWYFLPRYASVGTQNIVYTYRESPGSCYGYDTAVVRVLEASAIIEFPEKRTKYCRNETPFTVTGVNLTDNTGSFTISGGVGLTDNHNNTATIDPTLLSANEYTITYTYFDGTSLTVDSKFEIGAPPVADFTWQTECFKAGQSVRFRNASSSAFGIITASSWKIYTPTGYDADTSEDITYTFPEPGNYTVELKVLTSNGCSSINPKVFPLRPTINFKEDNYEENFESAPISWQSGPLPPAVNHWSLGDPSTGFSGPFNGDYCWFTNVPASGSPREQSWVTSPCFDFRGTKRPMLKMEVWRLFDSNRDGANIQATADSGKSWTLLGQIGDGIRWYNNYNILGKPGDLPVGWSAIKDGGWREARHSLDMLKGKTGVQFRITYGSDGTAQSHNGIAFDNIWIGEQSRTSLLEHFTNASDAASKDADIALNNLVNADTLSIIDLQYHTSFPGPDPFNEEEPVIPGARALYYGLSDVPYTILDGGARNSHLFDYASHLLEADTVHIESLLDSKFGINIFAHIDNNLLTTRTEVIAQQNLPASEFTVHVAIVERKITGITGGNGETVFENVVKTLLPDAAGTTLYRAWRSGEKAEVRNDWNLHNIKDPDEIRVIAFVQDESTREVYQVAIDTISIFTGIHDIPGMGNDNEFIVFPNPASGRVFVRFEKPVDRDVRIELFNSLGSIIYSGRVSRGEEETEIPTVNCPDGMYIIRAIARDGVTGIKKLTIAR